MRLDELKWIPGGAITGEITKEWARIKRRGRFQALIFKRPGGSYSIWFNDGYYSDNLDALTAQALLFELTREGNDAAE